MHQFVLLVIMDALTLCVYKTMNQYFLSRRPIKFALIFIIIDSVYLALLHMSAWGRNLKYIYFYSIWWRIGDKAMYLWNVVHFPIRFFIDPIFFPIITSHPLSIDTLSILIYEIICIFQSALIGYFFGIIIQKLSGIWKAGK